MNINSKYAILVVYTLFLLEHPALSVQADDKTSEELKYELYQYMLPYFQTKGGIVSMAMDNTKDRERGTLFIATQNNHLLIYYPNITGHYSLNQQILLSNKKDRVSNLQIYNTETKNTLLISHNNGKIVLYKSAQKTNAIFSWDSELQTQQFDSFETHFLIHNNSQYILVEKMHSNIKIYQRVNSFPANFSLLQEISFEESSKLSSFAFIDRMTTYQKPLLFITMQNSILIYQLLGNKFEKRQQNLARPAIQQNQTESYDEGQFLNIFETVVFTHQHTQSQKQDILITTSPSHLTLYAITYSNQQIISHFQQQITFRDKNNQGMIKRVESTEDGYLALLLSNNTVQIYGESTQNHYEKKTQILPQLKRRPHYQYLSIEFSDNHHQLVVNLFPEELNIYLSNDAPIYTQDNTILLHVLIPIFAFLAVFIFAILVIFCYFRYDFKSKIIPKIPNKGKEILSESRKHFPSSEDFSRDELYDIKTTNIINQREYEESALQIQSSDNSEVIHWKPEDQVHPEYDQQIIK